LSDNLRTAVEIDATRRSFALGAAACLGVSACGHTSGSATDATDESILQILKDRVDTQKQTLGIAVGIVSARGRRTISYGRLSAADPRTPNADTAFEIGSVTKVFTNLVFADMVRRGQIGLDDPLSSYLPDTVRLPEWSGRAITLVDLATHTSGLPTFPTNLGKPEYDATPTYSVKDLYEFLGSFPLPRAPGESWEYSNLGTSLLGLAISNKAGVTYKALIRQRILEPLRLRDTAFDPTRSMSQRAATGHEGDLQPVPRWELSLFRPGGGLRSTVNDLMTFLRGTLLGGNSSLAASTELMLSTRRPAPQQGGEQGLGWEILQVQGQPMLSKGGLVRGQTAALVFDQASRTGAAVLSNSNLPISDIARHLIRSSYPLMRAYTAIKVSPEVLDLYVGEYRTPIGTTIVIARLGDTIGVQNAPGGPQAALTATAENVFVAAGGLAELEFPRGDSGPATTLLIRRVGQAEVMAKRIQSGSQPN
jgi:serine-type D-Ala-D-Ala carboxypeptidase/endopeptidase